VLATGGQRPSYFGQRPSGRHARVRQTYLHRYGVASLSVVVTGCDAVTAAPTCTRPGRRRAVADVRDERKPARGGTRGGLDVVTRDRPGRGGCLGVGGSFA
jgi:hypothetical protein